MYVTRVSFTIVAFSHRHKTVLSSFISELLLTTDRLLFVILLAFLIIEEELIISEELLLILDRLLFVKLLSFPIIEEELIISEKPWYTRKMKRNKNIISKCMVHQLDKTAQKSF